MCVCVIVTCSRAVQIFVVLLAFHFFDCVPAVELSVVGAGSNFGTDLIKALSSSYRATRVGNAEGIDVEYTALDSLKGMCRIEKYSTECQNSDKSNPHNLDFAISNIMPEQIEYEIYEDLQMYPIVAGAVVPVYNLQSQNLVLTADIIARIYTMNITSWLDSQIVELNPKITTQFLNTDPNIKVFGRSDKNGASLVLSSSVSAATHSTTPEFTATIGSSSLPSWKLGTNLVVGATAMAAAVSQQTGALGYMGLGDAMKFEISIASIRKDDGSIVEASTTSLAYAAAEFGMEFGNNGDAPEHLTSNIYNAKSASAWPIARYSYLVMRKNTTRSGASCQNKHATVQFWYWFYTSKAATLIVQLYGFVPLTADAKQYVSTQLQLNTFCEGQRVFIDLPPSSIRVGLPSFVYDNLKYVFEGVYLGDSPTSSFVFSYTDQSSLLDSNHVVFIKGPPYPQSPLLSPSDTVQFPFVGASFCFVFNICFQNNTDCQANSTTLPVLTLTGNMILKILTGVICYWNDSELVALNPYFSNIHESIIFVTSHSMIGELSEIKYAFPSVMSSFVFNESKLNVKIMPSDIHILLEVTRLPYSLAFLHFDSSVEARALLHQSEDPVLVSSIARGDGTVVYPSLKSMRACAADTYDPVTNKFSLLESHNKECYPLTQCYRLVSKKAYHEAECDFNSAAVQVATFLAWLFSRGPLTLTFTSFCLFPLFSMTDEIFRKMKQQLLEITCNGSSLLAKPVNYNYISSWATPLAWSLSSVVLFSGLGFALCLFRYRSQKVVRFAQIEFMCMIIVGAILNTFSLVPLSFDDFGVQYYTLDDVLDLGTEVPHLNSACALVPWLYVTGFLFEFSAIFAKVLRLKKICVAKQMKRVRITFKDMLPILTGSLVCGWLLCAVWTGVAPLHWKRFAVTFDSSGYMTDSYAHCISEKFAWFYGAVAIFQFACLGYGMVLCYQTRNVQEDIVENKWITIVLINMLSTLVLTVVLGYFMRKNPAALFGIEIINALMTGFGVMCVMIVPKIYALYNLPLVLDGARQSDLVATAQARNTVPQQTHSRVHKI